MGQGTFYEPSARTLMVAFDDSSVMVSDRLGVLASNALIGIVLVAGFLWLFIGGRNTALVIWGMPVAYLGAVLMMYLNGTSVTVVSTFALLLVTGIIVDDAVIIVENVQRHIEMGKSRVQAAIEGSKEVFSAVSASTLTTCLAFAPLLLLEGVVGRVMAIIPVVVIFSLLASLVEAFLFFPVISATMHRSRRKKSENVPKHQAQRMGSPHTLLGSLGRFSVCLSADTGCGFGRLIFVDRLYAYITHDTRPTLSCLCKCRSTTRNRYR